MKRIVVSMKRFAFVGFWLCIAPLLLCLSARLFWIASRQETGLQTLELQWRDATVGWIMGDYQPVYMREPIEQADFWLPEVDRVLKTAPNDARLEMGAALVLDVPGNGYVARYMRRINRIPGMGAFPEMDHEAIERAENAFENKCHARCLELAAVACQHDSSNVEWPRLHALLLRRQSSFCYDAAPRATDWLEILDRCARKDPDNALYDYLAACFYWDASAKIDYAGTKERLVIKDSDQFERGIKRFERGQSKSCFTVGDAGYAAVTGFLSLARVSTAEREPIATSPRVAYCRFSLLLDLWRWQKHQADDKEASGDFKSALKIHGRNIRMLAQYTGTGPSATYDPNVTFFTVKTTTTIKTIADAHKASLSASEMQQILDTSTAVLSEQGILDLAWKQVVQGTPRTTGLKSTFRISAGTFIAGVAPSMVILLLAIGIISTILSRCIVVGDVPWIGPIAQIFALVLATAITTTLFGLSPAEVIDRGVQAWVFTIGLLSLPLVVAGWIGWLWLRRRAFQFSIGGLLMLTAVLSGILGLATACRPDGGYFAKFPFPLCIPARNLDGASAEVVGNAIVSTQGRSAWVAVQWAVNYGQYSTILIWAGLIIGLYLLRAKKRQAQSGSTRIGFGKLVGGACRSLARPAFVISAILLAIYLLLAPSILEQGEQAFQQKMAFARDPDKQRAQMDRAIQSVQSNPKSMKEVRDWVRAKASGAGE